MGQDYLGPTVNPQARRPFDTAGSCQLPWDTILYYNTIWETMGMESHNCCFIENHLYNSIHDVKYCNNFQYPCFYQISHQ